MNVYNAACSSSQIQGYILDRELSTFQHSFCIIMYMWPWVMYVCVCVYYSRPLSDCSFFTCLDTSVP